MSVPMSDSLFWVVFGLGVVLFVGGFLWQRKKIGDLRAVYANDPDVEIGASNWIFRMQTRPPNRAAYCVQAGGGKNNPPRWDIHCNVQLSGGLTLSLSKEGMLGGLREAIGFKDIHVGDAEFDKAFTIRGSNDEEIVALLQDSATKRAAFQLFALNVWRFKVDGSGRVYCAAPRGMLKDGTQIKALLLGVTALCDALEGTAAPSAASPFRSSAR